VTGQERDVPIELVVNGETSSVVVSPGLRLVDLLRDDLDLSGTKIGCETGHCGSCSVLLDGSVVCACLVFAAECDGRNVVTVEGLAGEGGAPNDVQTIVAASTAIQCGYCTPGIVIAATALLRENPDPSDEDIRQALVGNLCRCTGYQAYVRAIAVAARVRAEASVHT
jgi:aerobic carbon-monoxide dehydrogenase small subunit